MIICHLCLAGPYNEGWNYQENILPKYHVKQGYTVYQIVTPFMLSGDKEVRCDDTKYVNSDGVHIIRCSAKQGHIGGNRFNRYPEVSALLNDISPEILFIHNIQFLDAPAVADYLRKHPECTAYADSHTDFSNSARNWLSKNVLHKILWRHMAKILNPYVKKFYGVLPARVDFLTDVYGLPKDKCELLVMGADDELVEPAFAIRDETRKKYGIADGDFLVMTGGKIDSSKYQTILLMEAVHNISCENVKLLVFGSVSPELKEKVEMLADGKKVQFIGWVNAKDTYPLFAAADLIVFPGRHSVFWEQAAAQGVPLMVKYWEGTTHVDLGGNIVFLYEDSARLIEQEIRKILDKDAYQKMKRAAQFGREQFMYSNIAKRSIEQ